MILRELEAYGAGLAEKPRVLALNKIDALTPEAAAAAAAALAAASGLPVHRLSGRDRAGRARGAAGAARRRSRPRARRRRAEPEPAPWRP